MADLDRARLRELAEDAKRAREWLDGADRKRSHQKAVADAVGKLGLFKYEASPDALLALLDALDAAERERDAFKSLMYDEMDANLSFMADAGARPGENIANCLRRLLAERDTLAADARRWQAIDAHWRTAQCYFRKDATNSIRAVQMFIDFDHRNDGKALGGVVDEAIAALAAREPT